MNIEPKLSHLFFPLLFLKYSYSYNKGKILLLESANTLRTLKCLGKPQNKVFT